MQTLRPMRRPTLIAVVASTFFILVGPQAVVASDFEETLKRVDQALQKNPGRVNQMTLESCRSRRDFAIHLHRSNRTTRAERSLKFCTNVLGISETSAASKDATAASLAAMKRVQAEAAREVERALALTANVQKGLEIYRECAACHKPEGWGLHTGSVPQIAGQHRTVVIKQLADMRAGNRDNVMMAPYSSVESIGGAQAVADVAGYIDTLEISIETGKGPGDQLDLGAQLYRDNCTRCHGEQGEGNSDDFVPRIQSQHFNYLVRQFQWIRDGKRRNANAEMASQIEGFDDQQTRAVLDYVSRLEPPEEFRAPPGWKNPDFAD